MGAFNIYSSEQIEPLCSHFGTCGGCKFQHISYSEQIFQKQNFVETLFEQKTLPIICSDPHWKYRNKMEFSFSESKDGKKFLGLMQKKGRVVQLEECHLTNPWFIEILKDVYCWWKETPLKAYHPLSDTGTLRNLTLREGMNTGEKMVVLTISGKEDAVINPYLQDFTDLFNQIDSVVLRRQICQKKCPTRFEEELLFGKGFIHEILTDEDEKKWKFKIRPSSFFQPNTRQAEILYQEAVRHVEGKTVFDLYSGTGSIGIFASSKCDKIIGIEMISDAVSDAQDNILENGIFNMEMHLGDVEDLLGQFSDSVDTVIVDPPRAGLSAKTIHKLTEIRPRKIIYISCNPASQVENCRALPYKISILQPIDQFPHTPHIENIAILTLE